MIRKIFNNKAQTILEYSIVLGVVAAILFALGPMIKRATQAMIKITADQIGVQENADQNTSQGYLIGSNGTIASSSSKTKGEYAGNMTYTYADSVRTVSDQTVDLGTQPAPVP